MKVKLSMLIIGCAVLTALPVLTTAKGPAFSGTKTVYLYAGNSDTNAGASATMTYNISGSTFNFSFTGTAPVINDWYALVVGEDPLNHPETTVIIEYPRSDGTTGDIAINKSIELSRDLKKVQVMLVWARDITTTPQYDAITQWIGWHPEYSLFGNGLINYNDTNTH